MFGDPVARDARKSVEWYTPAWVFDLLGLEFDLDPCSPHDMATAVPARRKFTVFDDGLSRPWEGLVWLNPPYGPSTGVWIDRMIAHANGVALVFSRTDASWCQRAMSSADAMLFVAGRMEFVPGRENAHKRSRSGAGTVMFAWGPQACDGLRRMQHTGVLVERGLAREEATQKSPKAPEAKNLRLPQLRARAMASSMSPPEAAQRAERTEPADLFS